MKKIIILLLLTFKLIANDSEYYTSGNELVSLESANVRLDKEVLTIKHVEGFNFKVDVKYTLFNEGKERDEGKANKLLNIEKKIGKWYCYPKKSTLFDIKMYVYIESNENVLISFNVSPESLTWDSYAIPMKLIELQSFIKALNSVGKSYQIKRSGFQSCVITVDSTYKYTMYEKVYLWKIPVSFKTITLSVEALRELIQDFGE